MTSSGEVERIKKRLWYRQRMQKGKCCECSENVAVAQIVQDGKVMEARRMANCYPHLVDRRSK